MRFQIFYKVIILFILFLPNIYVFGESLEIPVNELGVIYPPPNDTIIG